MMKSRWDICRVGGLGMLLTVFVFVVGCDWTSKSDGFNTSRGRGDVNFSGTYQGNLGGGRAVENTSGGPIVRLVVSQQGDALEVLDNNGSRYQGRIGSVAIVSAPSEDGTTEFEDSSFNLGVFPEGTMLAQAQVSWSGHDNVAARTIEFAGTIHAVAVTDIRGRVDRDMQTRESVVTRESEDGTTTTTTTTIETAAGVTVIEIVIDNVTGQEISRKETVTGTRETGTTSEYILTAANTQYRLEGTWVEQGGVVAGVSALSAGAAGAIVVGASGTSTAQQ